MRGYKITIYNYIYSHHHNDNANKYDSI